MRPLYAASWVSQALPAVAYAFAPRRSRAAGLVVLGSLVSVFATAIGEILKVTHGNNLIAGYMSSPITVACYVWALREWLGTARERQVFWWASVGFMAAWAALIAWVEDIRAWDTYTFASYGLFILVPAIWTLVRRGTADDTVSFERSDWFWITLGLGLHGAINAIAGPVGTILVTRHRLDLFTTVWQTRAVLNVLAFLMISWGIRTGPREGT